MITIKRIQFLKIDNKELKEIVKNLIIKSNGKVSGYAFNEMVASIQKDHNFKDYQHLDPTQIQNAFSYFRFSPQQAKFRVKYNYFND